jgi:hypothetical protein
MITDTMTATGLHRVALIMDLSATVNRVLLHGDESELDLLSHDQLLLYLASTGVDPSHALWQRVEKILGHPITP